MAGDKVVH